MWFYSFSKWQVVINNHPETQFKSGGGVSDWVNSGKAFCLRPAAAERLWGVYDKYVCLFISVGLW